MEKYFLSVNPYPLLMVCWWLVMCVLNNFELFVDWLIVAILINMVGHYYFENLKGPLHPKKFNNSEIKHKMK
jgi:hypothetical protein